MLHTYYRRLVWSPDMKEKKIEQELKEKRQLERLAKTIPMCKACPTNGKITVLEIDYKWKDPEGVDTYPPPIYAFPCMDDEMWETLDLTRYNNICRKELKYILEWAVKPLQK